jgi:hypothetical protein
MPFPFGSLRRGISQLFDFPFGQVSPLPWAQIRQLQWADGNPSKLADWMSQHHHHAADLAISALCQDHTHLRSITL